jgi:hypothetical protein
LGRWVIALIAGAALVAAPSATSEVIAAQTVFRSATLAPNSITSLSLACPPGYLAASAGVSHPAVGVTTLGIRPLGLRTYAFRFGNPATNPSRRVTAAVSCRKIRTGSGRSAHFRVRPLKTKLVKLKGGSQASTSLECPGGTVPGGSGYDLRLSRGRGRGFSGSPVSIRARTQSLGRFAFTLRNSGAKPQGAALYGTCVTLVTPAGGHREWLHVKILTSAVQVHQGRQVVRRQCPRGWTAVAVGYTLPSGLTLDGAVALNVSARWSLTSTASGPTLTDLQLVCGRLAPR